MKTDYAIGLSDNEVAELAEKQGVGLKAYKVAQEHLPVATDVSSGGKDSSGINKAVRSASGLQLDSWSFSSRIRAKLT